jgi:hypothetical protein
VFALLLLTEAVDRGSAYTGVWETALLSKVVFSKALNKTGYNATLSATLWSCGILTLAAAQSLPLDSDVLQWLPYNVRELSSLWSNERWQQVKAQIPQLQLVQNQTLAKVPEDSLDQCCCGCMCFVVVRDAVLHSLFGVPQCLLLTNYVSIAIALVCACYNLHWYCRHSTT